MGLSLVVGILADLKGADDEGVEHYRAQFAAVNRALKAQNLPPHHEPEDLDSSYSGDMFGYSALHHLRRIAAHSWAGREMPGPADDDPSGDPLVDEYTSCMGLPPHPSLLSRLLGKPRPARPRYDHLMFHSDAEGYYLPQDFVEVIYPSDSLQVAGAMIGSSVRLKKECEALARILQLPPDLDADSDAVQEAADHPQITGAPWKAHGKAAHACLRLLEACDFSLKHRAAVVFC